MGEAETLTLGGWLGAWVASAASRPPAVPPLVCPCCGLKPTDGALRVHRIATPVAICRDCCTVWRDCGLTNPADIRREVRRQRGAGPDA